MKSVSISTRQGRCWIPALALALALGLSGCGGGDGAAVGTNDGAKKFAVAAIAKVEADQANVVAVSQVSEKRITRTVFEYVLMSQC